MRADSELIRFNGVRMKSLIISLAMVVALGVIAILQYSQYQASAQPSATDRSVTLMAGVAATDGDAAGAPDQGRFIARMQDRLDGLDQGLRQLQARMGRLSAASQAEAEGRIRALQAEADRLRDRAKHADEPGSGTWPVIEARLSRDVDQIGDDLRKADAWVSQKTT